MYIFFKGGYLQLGEVLNCPGETCEEKIANSFREEGIAFIKKLKHNFILFLRDSRTGDSYLVRDRFGIEPVYFKTPDFSFSQHLAGLRKKESIDKARVRDYLLNGTLGENVPDSGTFFEGLHIVPPACYIHLDAQGRLSCKAYWGPSPVDITGQKDSWLFEEFRERLCKSVVSSTAGLTAVGAHLSGGLDSSLITLVYAQIRKAPFPTFYFDLAGAEQNDLYFAGLVAHKAGCPHYRILPQKDVYSALYRLSKSTLAPEKFILPSGIHYAVGEAALGMGCSNILTGNDGDSVVGHGYAYLKELRKDDFEAFVSHLVRFRLSESKGAPSAVPGIRNQVIGSEIVRALRGKDIRRVLGIMKVARKKFGYVPLEFLNYLAKGVGKKLGALPVSQEAETLLRKDFRLPAVSRFEADDLYATGDKEVVDNFRAAVNAGFSSHFEQFYAMERDTGVRYLHPFFDKELFELCLAIPDAVRFGNGKTRWLMRNAMKDLWPDELYNRQDKDEFSHYLISSCKSLWEDNREKFEENRELWQYVDKSRFLKQMNILLKGKYPVAVSRNLAGKLNRVLYTGVWLDTLRSSAV